jgi:hypothetical protein
MEWKDLGNIVSTAAPVIGTAIGGPAGTIVGGAVSALLKAFGLTENATPDEVKKAIEQDPAAALKLTIAENEFAVKQRDQEIEALRVQLADVQSARGRQTEGEKATGKRDFNLYILAWTIVVGFFVLIVFLLEVPVPEDQSGVTFMLFGALSTGFGQVLQYFFGSSKSSSDKTLTIAQLRKGKDS